MYLLFLTIASSTAFAESWMVHTTGIAYDANSLRTDGDSVLVWERGIISDTSYALTLNEYDCLKKSMRILEGQIINTSSNKATRLSKSDLAENSEFRYLAPGSKYSKHLEVYCKKWYK